MAGALKERVARKLPRLSARKEKINNSLTLQTYHIRMQMRQNAGFTLIEISIVLVIIGLIVGGILLGQDLIHAARVRARLGRLRNTMRR